jgi:hypothetical protein
MYTVQQAYKAYMKGSIVISNMWLSFPHVRWHSFDELIRLIREMEKTHNQYASVLAPNSYLEAHELEREYGQVPKYFILMDEVALYFFSRNW